jgi:hypothetical protein
MYDRLSSKEEGYEVPTIAASRLTNKIIDD